MKKFSVHCRAFLRMFLNSSGYRYSIDLYISEPCSFTSVIQICVPYTGNKTAKKPPDKFFSHSAVSEDYDKFYGGTISVCGVGKFWIRIRINPHSFCCPGSVLVMRMRIRVQEHGNIPKFTYKPDILPFTKVIKLLNLASDPAL